MGGMQTQQMMQGNMMQQQAMAQAMAAQRAMLSQQGGGLLAPSSSGLSGSQLPPMGGRGGLGSLFSSMQGMSGGLPGGLGGYQGPQAPQAPSNMVPDNQILMCVNVPEGARPNEEILVVAPDGRKFMVVVSGARTRQPRPAP